MIVKKTYEIEQENHTNIIVTDHYDGTFTLSQVGEGGQDAVFLDTEGLTVLLEIFDEGPG